jgi:hypothetical protein
MLYTLHTFLTCSVFATSAAAVLSEMNNMISAGARWQELRQQLQHLVTSSHDYESLLCLI